MNPRKILLELTVNWPDYDDVCDELIIEDTGIYDAVKEGVTIKIMTDENRN